MSTILARNKRYKGNSPSFGFQYSVDKLLWTHCREIFAPRLRERAKQAKKDKAKEIKMQIYYCIYHGGGFHYRLKSLNKAMSEIEDRLQLKRHMVFETYENNSCIAQVTVPIFWLQYKVRQELLTILLRAPVQTNVKTIDALKRFDPYLASTSKVFEKFLSGKTRAKKKFKEGWYETFLNNENSSLLV